MMMIIMIKIYKKNRLTLDKENLKTKVKDKKEMEEREGLGEYKWRRRGGRGTEENVE